MITLLRVNHLAVVRQDRAIIHDVSLTIQPGSVHALMGPNGSGKSSLAHTLMGHSAYHIKSGSIEFAGKNITHMPVDQRARHGIFLSFQHPLVIPGVRVLTFLHEAHTALSGTVLSIDEFSQLVKNKMSLLGMDESFLFRNLNEGFSGGEKKRLELLQCFILQPKLAIFDEIDSGLDVDALQQVARGINQMRKGNPDFAILIITHYARILQLIEPDVVRIMSEGNIVASGDKQLAYQIDQKGYKEKEQ